MAAGQPPRDRRRHAAPVDTRPAGRAERLQYPGDCQRDVRPRGSLAGASLGERAEPASMAGGRAVPARERGRPHLAARRTGPHATGAPRKRGEPPHRSQRRAPRHLRLRFPDESDHLERGAAPDRRDRPGDGFPHDGDHLGPRPSGGPRTAAAALRQCHDHRPVVRGRVPDRHAGRPGEMVRGRHGGHPGCARQAGPPERRHLRHHQPETERTGAP